MRNEDVSQPEHAVTTRYDVRIPARDGVELSANLWLPVPRTPGSDRFPAILEMIPYRKDDWRLAGDTARGEWLAARGFAFCRLDVRGTGSSPGIALDEYTESETLDGYDAVEWLASQSWCNGNVGMWGISYGGMTAIQVAALRPPHLKAIVPMMASDDRYTDDVHYIGGCATLSELSQYAVRMVGLNALPPKPGYRGDVWLDEWRDRLEHTPPWWFGWRRQQVDGPYWRRGSLAPNHDAIEAAIFLIGGWMDSYVDAALRMQERCRSPRRTLIGNWVHRYPDDAYPGPNIDWLHEMLRFFDHWLKGVDNGVMEEPALVCFMRQYAEPEPFPSSWPGTWIAREAYPPPDVVKQMWHLADGGTPLIGLLATSPDPIASVVEFRHRSTTGTRGALSWGSGLPPNGLARDLRPDESVNPTFTSPPLERPLDILGRPEAQLTWQSSVPVAAAVVRLSDVAPDGTSAQISIGILNLTHRESHVDPTPIVPGELTEIHVLMRGTAYRVLPGHRIRLSVATSAWPVIWPSPQPARHSLHVGGANRSRLLLPIATGDGLPVPEMLPAPAGAAPSGSVAVEPPTWTITEDVLEDTVTVASREFARFEVPDGETVFSMGERFEMSASDDDPSSARLSNDVVCRLETADRTVETRATGTTSTSQTEFDLEVSLEVDLDGDPFFRRTWTESIPRHLL